METFLKHSQEKTKKKKSPQIQIISFLKKKKSKSSLFSSKKPKSSIFFPQAKKSKDLPSLSSSKKDKKNHLCSKLYYLSSNQKTNLRNMNQGKNYEQLYQISINIKSHVKTQTTLGWESNNDQNKIRRCCYIEAIPKKTNIWGNPSKSSHEAIPQN